ncbi:MAG: Gfo/Idh/MocA family oxidoreductase [Acidimicrobiia bacterium]|nr:Gfo/Idh/MocA family oxidoreductase [Acidimicrobiia bacterium]
MNPVRIGVLGAAKIAPKAVIEPARTLPEVEIVAVAAREPERARAFAAEQGIGRVHDTYEALVTDPEIDAVYNPLPNALHGRWTIAALEAGKHVLCEKPFTANAEEAEKVGAAAERAGTVVMEALHDRYHPLAIRMREVVASGELGALRHLTARMLAVLPERGNQRYRLDLAGGSLMDVGCYSIHQLRTLASAEPTVVEARAKLSSPGVDRWMRANLAFPDGGTGRVTCGLLSAQVPTVDLRIEGDAGVLTAWFPNRPQLFKGFTVKLRGGGKRRERIVGESTYWYQLQAFCAAVQHGAPVLTPPADSIANMRVIDAVYEAAGMEPRRPSV